MDTTTSASSSPARPRQADGFNQEETRRGINAKSPGRAASNADRSSVLTSSSPLISTTSDTNIVDAHTNTVDALSPTNARKRKNNAEDSSGASPLKSPRLDNISSGHGNTDEDSSTDNTPMDPLPGTPAALDAPFRTLSQIDLQAELTKYPADWRNKLTDLHDYYISHTLDEWLEMVTDVSKWIHRDQRVAFVDAAQTLCRVDDELLPPTVLLHRRFNRATLAEITEAIPRLDDSDVVTEERLDTEDTIDWDNPNPLQLPSPVRPPRMARDDSRLSHDSDLSAGIISDLSSAALSPLRLRLNSVAELTGHTFFNETTRGMTDSSSAMSSSSPVSSKSRSSATRSARSHRFSPLARPSPTPSLRSARTPTPPRSSTPLRTARSPSPRTARSPSPRTARSPSPLPPQPPTPLPDLEKRIQEALDHLTGVGTVDAKALDYILTLRRGRSSCRTLLKKLMAGHDVQTKTAAFLKRVNPIILKVKAY